MPSFRTFRRRYWPSKPVCLALVLSFTAATAAQAADPASSIPLLSPDSFVLAVPPRPWEGPPASRAALGPAAPNRLCAAAIAASEHRHGLPAGLLTAMALTESGRLGSTGRQAWPWTTDVDGVGHFFDDKAQAIAFVQQVQASGKDSIDVGCLQVNLRHHPKAFASLDEAFDPAANVEYAARYLLALRQISPTGNWMEAAGFYHSMTPDRAEGYRTQVQAELIALAAPALPPSPGPSHLQASLFPVGLSLDPVIARTALNTNGALIPFGNLIGPATAFAPAGRVRAAARRKRS